MLVKETPGKRHTISLLESQHWFGKWFGVIRQQAITWTNVDQVIWRNMASRGRYDYEQVSWTSFKIPQWEELTKCNFPRDRRNIWQNIVDISQTWLWGWFPKSPTIFSRVLCYDFNATCIFLSLTFDPWLLSNISWHFWLGSVTPRSCCYGYCRSSSTVPSHRPLAR